MTTLSARSVSIDASNAASRRLFVEATVLDEARPSPRRIATL
jgi:hypothetical protein